MSSITRILTKTRGLIDDLEQTTTESFTVVSSEIFELGEIANSIVQVEVDGDTSGVVYTLSTTTNKVTVSSPNLVANDIVKIKYKYYAKYTDTEIKSYIEGAFSYISIHGVNNFYIESALRIYPYPTEEEENLISIVTSILIGANYSRYRTSTVSIDYPKTKSKKEQIAEVIGYYKHCRNLGIFFIA